MPGDLFACASIALSVVMALLPRRAWAPVARFAAAASFRRPGRAASLASRVPPALALASGLAAPEVARRNQAATHMALAEYARVRVPWLSPAPIRVEGMGHVREALDRGTGVVLWVHGFAASSLLAKVALHREGVPVTHLSRAGHGLSHSRFGLRYLNRFVTKAEERHLARRVVIEGDGLGALRRLREVLRANGVVSVTVGHDGRRVYTVPVFGRQMRLASGAISLSVAAGAALLPVYTVRAARGHYRVIIGPPLDSEGLASGAGSAAWLEFARQLEATVAAHPGDWSAWQSRVMPRPDQQPLR
ncbi:MAG: hypothetical protein ACR2HN_04805 [Tepidiformaceae bacterium]